MGGWGALVGGLVGCVIVVQLQLNGLQDLTNAATLAPTLTACSRALHQLRC